MGFLEVCLEMMNLGGTYDVTSPHYRLASFIILVAALFLARHLKAPRKDEGLR